MILLLKIATIICCAVIALQDFRERAVQWVLFPLLALTMTWLYLENAPYDQYLMFVFVNVLVVTVILLILYLYTKHIARMKFLNVSFGLGDLLFFYAFALGFPTLTFIILFVGSIFFSLMVFWFSLRRQNKDTIPLAGLMGLFLIGIHLASFVPNLPSLYRF